MCFAKKENNQQAINNSQKLMKILKFIYKFLNKFGVFVFAFDFNGVLKNTPEPLVGNHCNQLTGGVTQF